MATWQSVVRWTLVLAAALLFSRAAQRGKAIKPAFLRHGENV